MNLNTEGFVTPDSHPVIMKADLTVMVFRFGLGSDCSIFVGVGAESSWGVKGLYSKKLTIFFSSYTKFNFLFSYYFYCCPIKLSWFPRCTPLSHPSPTAPTVNCHPFVHALGSLYKFLDLPHLLLFPVIPISPLLWWLSFCFHYHASGYILLVCLFCWLGSTYMVLVFYHLAYFT